MHLLSNSVTVYTPSPHCHICTSPAYSPKNHLIHLYMYVCLYVCSSSIIASPLSFTGLLYTLMFFQDEAVL